MSQRRASVVASLGSIAAAQSPTAVGMRFVFAPAPPPAGAAPGAWQRVMLAYDDGGTPRSIDTGLVDVHCAHDAWAEMAAVRVLEASGEPGAGA